MPKTSGATESAPPRSERLVSLDAFRGLTIAGMILVNNAGTWDQVYPPLRHAEWHGWTPTDLVFPFFLFIVGVSITFSLAKYSGGPELRRGLYWRILRRTLIIFALGLFLNAFPDFDLATLRIPGVLQRIALVYLAAALITAKTRAKTQAWIAGGLLILYWALVKLIPVTGFGAGQLTVEGNLASHIDDYLLHGHVYRGTWDPEGLLSTIPAISTALAGVLTGHLIRSRLSRVEITVWMFVAGWGGILGGYVWDLWFPINKNLWTSSYVLFTAGAALQVLGICYWLIDGQGWRKWAYPAVVFGVNAIALYALSGVVTDLTLAIEVPDSAGALIPLKVWIFENAFAPWAAPANASLAFALANVLFWWLIMDILYRRRIFIKI